MNGYLADTSIFIASERGRSLQDAPPGQSRISVVTLTELLMGRLSVHERPGITIRERTLAKARSFVALAYDEPVAAALADLLIAARSQNRRASMPDAIIAATALVHDLAVWTLDSDFAAMAEIEPALQVHRA